MRRDVERAHAGMVRQHEADRRRLSPLPAPLFEHVRDRAGTQRVGPERLGHGRGEFLRAVVVEEPEEPGRVDRSDSPRVAKRSKSVATMGTARRRRSRALDGLAGRVAAMRPAMCVSSSIVCPVS